MSSQTRYNVVFDEEIRQGLKDTIAKLMREELEKLRNELMNVTMTDNNGVMVKRGMQNMPKFGGTDIKFEEIAKHECTIMASVKRSMEIESNNTCLMDVDEVCKVEDDIKDTRVNWSKNKAHYLVMDVSEIMDHTNGSEMAARCVVDCERKHKQKGDYQIRTTCFSFVASRTRSELSVSRRIKDTCNMEILTYGLESDSIKESIRCEVSGSLFPTFGLSCLGSNDEIFEAEHQETYEKHEDNFGQLEFKLWKWPKMKKKGGKCKLKYGKWGFDI
ncbi:hypothetical protein Tco_1272712 [Tanacetum coccineum]